MLFINGMKDKLFPVPERLVTELWDMPHGCPPEAQQRVVEFFDKNL